MPAHLIKRGKQGLYSILDGHRRLALRTSKHGFAKILLDKYLQGKLRIRVNQSVQSAYTDWIQVMESSNLRPMLLRDYKYSFSKHILPVVGKLDLSAVDYACLVALQAVLLQTLKVKSAQNIINANFRAFWRWARKSELVHDNPFELLEWPVSEREKPNPFSLHQQARIVAWWMDHDDFHWPYVAWQFETGMRPSETAGLKLADLVTHSIPWQIQIQRSQVMGNVGRTKTKASRRTIALSPVAQDIVELVLSRAKSEQQWLFVGKRGDPMTKKWAEHNWAKPLVELGIEHHKFYCTRHTFITERLKAGSNPFSVAQYCGTSAQMLQDHYAGVIPLPRANYAPSEEIPQRNVVAGPGFEHEISLADAPSYSAIVRLIAEKKVKPFLNSS